MPRQNTSPAHFPPHILAQIEQVAARVVAARKQAGATQLQWAQQLGISQPTMARLERGDPSVATATYVMCLWLINPQLNLCSLLDNPCAVATTPCAATAGDTAAPALAFEIPAPAAATTLDSPRNVADDFAQLLHSFAPRAAAL